MPILMDVELTTDTYSVEVKMKEKGAQYSTEMTFKDGKDELISCDVLMTYNADMSSPKTTEGVCIASPLKFEGTVNYEAIDTYTSEYESSGMEPDLDYLNSQMDVDVIQIENNAKIGVLAYYMQYDADFDEYVAVLAIEYIDGTYEWLDEVMTVMEM